MDVSHQQIFQNLKKQIDNARSHQSHLLIFTFVGSGSSYLLKFLAKLDSTLTYINSPDQSLGDYSLLDLSLSEALVFLDKVNLNQKCALLINNGSDFHSPLLKNYKTHLYLSFPLSTRSLKDSSCIAREINPSLSQKQINEIYKYSQGVSKIIKHLSINPSSISTPDSVLNNIVDDVLSSLRSYSAKEIESLGISFPFANRDFKKFPIIINFDLSFSENSVLSPSHLSPTESRILQKIIDNSGKISKEQVSDIKWGENKYDEFSDQAINKTIRRLSSKLTQYSIKTIPKIGFILEANAR